VYTISGGKPGDFPPLKFFLSYSFLPSNFLYEQLAILNHSGKSNELCKSKPAVFSDKKGFLSISQGELVVVSSRDLIHSTVETK